MNDASKALPIHVIVVTHGGLADELVAAARTIVGGEDSLEAVSLGWNEDLETSRERIRRAAARAGGRQGALILTDMFGGTPTNIALTLQKELNVEVVTGVNLSMVIKAAGLRAPVALVDAARLVAARGREAIQTASQLLQEGRAADDGGTGA